MSRFTRIAAVCLPLVGGLMLASIASAQEAQPAPGPAAPQRCGGLICDAYYGSNPEAKPGSLFLPCHDFLCAAFGGRTADEPPAVQQAAVPEPEPVKPKVKKKHVAKAAAKVATKSAEKPAEPPAQ